MEKGFHNQRKVSRIRMLIIIEHYWQHVTSRDHFAIYLLLLLHQFGLHFSRGFAKLITTKMDLSGLYWIWRKAISKCHLLPLSDRSAEDHRIPLWMSRAS